MAITWKQIDTNGNGYVDGTEAVTAKAKGVKNVWNNMTELDYITNTTKSEKLSKIIANFPDDPTRVTIYQNIVMGYTEEQRQAMYTKKREAIEKRLLELNRKNEKYTKQIEDYEQQMKAKLDTVPYSTRDSIAKAVQGVGNFCNEYLGCSFDTSLEQERQARVEKRKEIEDKFVPLIRHIRETRQSVQNEMRSLVEEHEHMCG